MVAGEHGQKVLPCWAERKWLLPACLRGAGSWVGWLCKWSLCSLGSPGEPGTGWVGGWSFMLFAWPGGTAVPCRQAHSAVELKIILGDRSAVL